MSYEKNFVPALPSPTVKTQKIVDVLPPSEYVLDITSSVSHETKNVTNARDKAYGFLLMNVPLFGSFAIGVWALASWQTGYPLLNMVGFLILWLSFVAGWLLMYLYTLFFSLEGVALYEARQKYLIVRREQEYRWSVVEDKIEKSA